MAIPQYLRERLASSQTGVPAPDMSGAKIAESVSQLAGGLGKQMLEFDIQRKEALDAVDANNLLTEFDINSQNVLQEHQRAYSSDPANKSQYLKENLDDQLNQVLDRTDNPRVKQLVQKHASAKLGQRVIEENEWAYKQQNIVAGQKIVQTNNTLAIQANLIGASLDLSTGEKMQMVSDLFTSVDGNIAAASGVLSAEQLAKFKLDHPHSVAKGFISGLIDKDPQAAVAILSSPEAFMESTVDENGKVTRLRDMLGNDRETMKKEAQEKFKSQVSTAELNRQVDAAMAHQDVYGKIVDKTVSVTDFDNLAASATTPEEKQQVQTLRSIYLKNAGFDALTDDKKYIDFTVKYEKIKQDLKDSKYKNIKGPLKDLINFDQELSDAVDQGFIRQEEARSVQRLMTGPLLKKIKKQDGGFWGFKSPVDTGYATINDWLKSNGRDKDYVTKGKMLRAFTRQLDAHPDMNQNEAKDAAETIGVQIAQDLIKGQALSDNPSLGRLPATPNAVMGQDGQVKNILSGTSQLTPNVNIKAPYIEQVNKVTGERRRVYPDGRIDTLPKGR